MYSQYVKNCEMLNEFFFGHAERMKAINESYVEAFQNLMKVDEQYGDLFKSNENVHALNVAYIVVFSEIE